MSEIFGNDSKLRGCFMVHRMKKGASRGAQLILPNGELPKSSYSEPLLCTGFDCQLREKVLFNKCFAGRTFTYAFGHDPNASQLSVHMLGFLVSPQGYSKVVDNVVRAYMTNRVSSRPDWAMLMLGKSKPLRGFVVGLSSQSTDQQHSLQSFTIHLAIPTV